ncbi:hypothetical protein J6590_058426 [Homalodisca vitripennis]|nr:hypothetical protein J6590_058426 [Homalodisca vitripennis]
MEGCDQTLPLYEAPMSLPITAHFTHQWKCNSQGDLVDIAENARHDRRLASLTTPTTHIVSGPSRPNPEAYDIYNIMISERLHLLNFPDTERSQVVGALCSRDSPGTRRPLEAPGLCRQTTAIRLWSLRPLGALCSRDSSGTRRPLEASGLCRQTTAIRLWSLRPLGALCSRDSSGTRRPLEASGLCRQTTAIRLWSLRPL